MNTVQIAWWKNIKGIVKKMELIFWGITFHIEGVWDVDLLLKEIRGVIIWHVDVASSFAINVENSGLDAIFVRKEARMQYIPFLFLEEERSKIIEIMRFKHKEEEIGPTLNWKENNQGTKTFLN